MRQWVDGRTKSAGEFYRGEAARVALEAATRQLQPTTPPPPPLAPDARVYVPPVLLDEPQRPPLSPERAINQNDDPADDRRRPLRRVDSEEDDIPPLGLARIIAWIVLAPWYGAIAVASLGIDLMFAKDLLGL